MIQSLRRVDGVVVKKIEKLNIIFFPWDLYWHTSKYTYFEIIYLLLKRQLYQLYLLVNVKLQVFHLVKLLEHSHLLGYTAYKKSKRWVFLVKDLKKNSIFGHFFPNVTRIHFSIKILVSNRQTYVLVNVTSFN